MGFTGCCNCGAVRFSIDKIEKVLLCSCRTHKRLTGSLLSGFAIVKDSKFFLYCPSTDSTDASARAEYYRRAIFGPASPSSAPSSGSLVVHPSSSPPPGASSISPPLPPEFSVSARSVSPLPEPEPEPEPETAHVNLPRSGSPPSTTGSSSTPAAPAYTPTPLSPTGDVLESPPLSPTSLRMYASTSNGAENAMKTWFCSCCGTVLWAINLIGEFGLRSVLIGTLDVLPSTTTDLWEMRAVLQKWSRAEVVVGCTSEKAKGKEKEEWEGEVKLAERPLSRSGSGSWTPLEPIPEEEEEGNGKMEEPKTPQRAVVRLPGRSHILAVRSKSMGSLE